MRVVFDTKLNQSAGAFVMEYALTILKEDQEHFMIFRRKVRGYDCLCETKLVQLDGNDVQEDLNRFLRKKKLNLNIALQA